MKILAHITEKSLADATLGKYTFVVDKALTKRQLKIEIGRTFGVVVRGISTLNYKSTVRKTVKGVVVKTNAFKKVVVTLNEKDKIDLFDTKKK